MEYKLPFVTWFWLIMPNAAIILLSFINLYLSKKED